ncbi:hypothetical protein K0M31_014026 [Melipona bicolor]|uniref:Uncharacterized protein n=1 Tax=Melipona bicolor TaxID=60889 RepID=A0AA40G7Y3_9HYME|nr:hypothetical protein K0M31_014026 [Melipona bicolor]
MMEGEIKLADPSLFSPRFRESSLEELGDWSTLLEGEPSRTSRIPSRPPRRMYTVVGVEIESLAAVAAAAVVTSYF